MDKDPYIFIKHILESIRYIESFVKNKSKSDFLKSVQLQDAILRRLEIIGEATKNISEEFKFTHPDLPWKEMIKTRDKLIHGYFGVDLDLTWDIIEKDLPDLKKRINKILKNLK